jgi:cytoskeletal protein CcmA (bactofilin family)
MFGKDPENLDTDGRQTSILAQGCRFEGKVQAAGTFRIEGEFQGDVGTPESLIIGKTGVVNGSIKVKNAIIGGQLYGDITAENKIELQSGSHVEGDIKTKRLVIDEGVFFEGNCSMGGPKQGPKGPPPPGGATAPAAARPPEDRPKGS